MSIIILPTKTSLIELELDINNFGLGWLLTFKNEYAQFYSLALHFLFITLYFEWAISDEEDDDDAI